MLRKLNLNKEQIFVEPNSSIRIAISCIDKNDAKIALVVNEHLTLVDTITDGDIRRAILLGYSLDDSVSILKQMKIVSGIDSDPITAPIHLNDREILQLMTNHQIHQIPLVDSNTTVCGLAVITDPSIVQSDSINALVMVGGYGTRLQPLTEDTPKPMLPMGDKPLLENIIHQLKDIGVGQVSLATHFKGEIISEHFGDGTDFGVAIQYLTEDEPLGTAGALGMLQSNNKPVLVMNGDILTQIDFLSMIDFHKTHNADMTVCVSQHELYNPYGVVETDGIFVTNLVEKPVIKSFINAGIYLLNPDMINYVTPGNRCDMTDLILNAINDDRRVISFPVREYWLDIGHLDDYQQALTDIHEEGNQLML